MTRHYESLAKGPVYILSEGHHFDGDKVEDYDPDEVYEQVVTDEFAVVIGNAWDAAGVIEGGRLELVLFFLEIVKGLLEQEDPRESYIG